MLHAMLHRVSGPLVQSWRKHNHLFITKKSPRSLWIFRIHLESILLFRWKTMEWYSFVVFPRIIHTLGYTTMIRHHLGFPCVISLAFIQTWPPCDKGLLAHNNNSIHHSSCWEMLMIQIMSMIFSHKLLFVVLRDINLCIMRLVQFDSLCEALLAEALE